VVIREQTIGRCREVTRHGQAQPYSWSVTSVSLRRSKSCDEMRAGVEPKPELRCMLAWIVPGTCQARATSIPGLHVDLRASLRTFTQPSAIADAFLTQERSRCRLRKYSESLRYSLHSVISSHYLPSTFSSFSFALKFLRRKISLRWCLLIHNAELCIEAVIRKNCIPRDPILQSA